MTRPKTNLTQDQINEIFERRRLRESIREIATKMGLTYYTVWSALQESPDPEPALQERDDQSGNESQSNTSPFASSRVVEAGLEGSNEVKSEGARSALRIAELFELSNSGVLTLGGLAYSFGFRSIGDFFHAQVVPWMRWVQEMTVRLNMVPTPERLNRLLIDGAEAASVLNRIQKNKKLWAYIRDYLN